MGSRGKEKRQAEAGLLPFPFWPSKAWSKEHREAGERRRIIGGDHQELVRGPGTVLALPLAGCVSSGKPLAFSVLHVPFCSVGGRELMAVEGLVRQQP